MATATRVEPVSEVETAPRTSPNADRIRLAVLRSLGRPPELIRVSVLPLWGDKFRVNVVYPTEYLADGGFAQHADLEAVAGHGVTVYAPVPQPKDPARDRHQPRAADSAVVAGWRERMGTAGAKAIYKDRASTIECVNAQARNRGLVRLLVRGVEKVKAVVLWFAVAHNVACGARLRADRLAVAT